VQGARALPQRFRGSDLEFFRADTDHVKVYLECGNPIKKRQKGFFANCTNF